MNWSKRYRLWVDRNGRPKIVECLVELDPEEATRMVDQFEASKNGNLLIVGPDWEVRSL